MFFKSEKTPLKSGATLLKTAAIPLLLLRHCQNNLPACSVSPNKVKLVLKYQQSMQLLISVKLLKP